MKKDFHIQKINKEQSREILFKYHYLTGISRGFKSGYNYGLFNGNSLVGVIIFTGFPVPELAVGMLGLKRCEQDGLFELSRLCICPNTQEEEHNIASYFVSHSIKKLRKDTNVRVILSYADADYHKGTVYRACNFKYYGLTDQKTDFWIKQKDGTFLKHSRGKIKHLEGEWRKRSRKHRFVMLFNKTLMIKWKEVMYGKI